MSGEGDRQCVIAAAIRAGDRPGRDDSRDYRTPAQVPVLAPMSLGAVLVLAAVVVCALGVLLAWLGGAT